MTPSTKPTPPNGRQQIALPDVVSRQIALAVCSIRFGSVEITIHEGHVVQIEKREKIRLESFRVS